MRKKLTLIATAIALLSQPSPQRRSTDDLSIIGAMRFLVQHEGVVLADYEDTAGYTTFGIGHKKIGNEKAPTTVEEALNLLRTDIQKHLPCILEYRDFLNDHQFAALISFVFNIGCPAFKSQKCSVRKHIEAGNLDLVPAAMALYNKRRNKLTGLLEIDDGLINRRNAEIKLWKGFTWPSYSTT